MVLILGPAYDGRKDEFPTLPAIPAPPSPPCRTYRPAAGGDLSSRPVTLTDPYRLVTAGRAR
ncbi:hypothetical protein [Streptomyces sp. 35G-GA-8]|uniref:hypothetical protein n=1 Tax=Streptomyces sp. 35G-GA-8 TaxID=2939434 RepID=UPI00201E8F39|nr:hypothetical protein [Streptomyces sp. 35G-GA-8]MCL7375376.1 hypothetical protein [Streptomyces sp. 35G-GA-8]